MSNRGQDRRMSNRGQDRRKTERREDNAPVEQDKRGHEQRRSGTDRRKVSDRPQK